MLYDHFIPEASLPKEYPTLPHENTFKMRFRCPAESDQADDSLRGVDGLLEDRREFL